jgi:hypothetical protein
MQTEQLFRVGGTDFTAILEHSPIAMVVGMGVEEKVLMVNQKFIELFGVYAGRYLGFTSLVGAFLSEREIPGRSQN